MPQEIPSSRSFPLYSGCNYKIKEGQNKGKDRREKEGHPMSCLAITFTTQQINSKRQDIGATIFQRTSKRRVFFNVETSMLCRYEPHLLDYQFINIMSIFWLSFYSRVLFLVHWDLARAPQYSEGRIESTESQTHMWLSFQLSGWIRDFLCHNLENQPAGYSP